MIDFKLNVIKYTEIIAKQLWLYYFAVYIFLDQIFSETCKAVYFADAESIFGYGTILWHDYVFNSEHMYQHDYQPIEINLESIPQT